jgi:glycosyltransferase involved in cell wall biosynthesis
MLSRSSEHKEEIVRESNFRIKFMKPYIQQEKVSISNPPLRLMHLCLSLDMGGAEILVVQMANDQAERFVHPPIIATLTQSADPFLPARVSPCVRQVNLGMQERLDHKVILHLRRCIRELKVEVIHAHSHSPLLAAVLAGVGLPVRILYTHHGSGIPAFFNKNLFLRNWLLRKTRIFVGVSPEASGKLLEAFAGYIPSSRLKTIINGVAESPRHSAIKERTSQTLPPYTGYTIGYVGRLVELKRVDLLVEALAQLRADCIDCRLVLVGDGEQREALEMQVRRLHLQEYVLFMGARSDVTELLAEFDVFANSSRTEGISLSILEAMSAGLPVVATAVGGTPVLIEDGVSGRLVEASSALALASAIQSLLLDAEQRTRIGRAANRRATEHFSFRAMMEQYEKLY